MNQNNNQKSQSVSQQSVVRVVETNDNNNGQNKCPKCGATGTIFNMEKGVLICTSCRYEFQPEIVINMVDDIIQLQGQVIGTGAANIDTDANDIVTLKCTSCGAEVVVDTSTTTSARCHWCRNILSINEKVPNGAVPDIVLPFYIKKRRCGGKY